MKIIESVKKKAPAIIAIDSKRLDALRAGTVFRFRKRSWTYLGKCRGAGGLSNVVDSSGARTWLPSSTIVEERPKASKASKAKAPSAPRARR